MDIIKNVEKKQCGFCKGSGNCSKCHNGICSRCKGKGELNTTYLRDGLLFSHRVENPNYCPLCRGNHLCVSCNGTRRCSACNGSGWV